MYSIYQFGRMMGDPIRMDAYVRALEAAVTPGCTVIDLGTGSGIFALLACRFGAGRVYAIEPDDVIHVARRLAEANDLADRIEFIQEDSRDYQPTDRADVLISDLRGVLPFFKTHIPTIVDARERLLKDGGIQIPLRDEVYVAVVEAEANYQRYTAPWDSNDYGFELGPVRHLLLNNWVRARVTHEMLLSDAEHCCTLDYPSIDSPNVASSNEFTISRDATGHGISAWFDATIAEGIGFTNRPGAPELGYSMAFFPWEKPVELRHGDRVELQFDARLSGDDYLFSWRTRIFRGQLQIAGFRQSTFFSSPALYRTKR